MTRLMSAIGALAATICLMMGAGGAPSLAYPARTVIVGEREPVFLGRLVVSATALPAGAVRR